jgi:heme oxygenase
MCERAADTVPDPSAHQMLRAATADLHAAVDRRFGGHDLGVPDQYATFLSMQAAALVPLELALEAAGIARALPDWPMRCRRGALLADLAALGRPAVVFGGSHALACGPEAIGAAYVLEGSRLGSAVLLRQVGPGLPDAFLRHGAGQALWRGFLPRLAQLPPADIPLAIRGARRAFTQFLAGTQP